MKETSQVVLVYIFKEKIVTSNERISNWKRIDKIEMRKQKIISSDVHKGNKKEHE